MGFRSQLSSTAGEMRMWFRVERSVRGSSTRNWRCGLILLDEGLGFGKYITNLNALDGGTVHVCVQRRGHASVKGDGKPLKGPERYRFLTPSKLKNSADQRVKGAAIECSPAILAGSSSVVKSIMESSSM